MSKQPKKMTPQQVSKIKELSQAGNSSYKIAKIMGIPPGVARYHIQRDKLTKLSSSSPQIHRTPTNNVSEIERLKSMNKQLLDMINNLMGA